VDAQEKDVLLSSNEELGYPILVGTSLRRDFVRFVRTTTDRFVVLTDERPAVAAYARELTDGIPGRLGFLRMPLGERRKRLATVERTLELLLAHGADRQTLIVGLGGGVANDLFGFAAATFMRGVPYAHVATSLVAMADAAVGGKTGVDLSGGKNIAGVFKDPQAVFCPTETLQTLPFRHIREGLAEVVKHAIIAGNGLFDALENLAPHPFAKWLWPAVVASSVDVKAAVVAGDPREGGTREVLNLGHTFAHAIERASAFRISHGAAVSLGLRGAGLLALRNDRFSER
jgi:3-dehydroquinate synthetase